MSSIRANVILRSPRRHSEPRRGEESQNKILRGSSSETAGSAQDDGLPDKTKIRQFFDAIAFRYDFLNQFLSFRLDESWRRRARDLVMDGRQKSLLDLGIGTGKFLREFLEGNSWQRLAGVDFSSAMLQAARKELPRQIELIEADFHELPFQDESFDLIISGFTLRSVKDMPHFLKEIHRLLTRGGKTALLCLTRPKNLFWRILYYPYLKFYLPLVGGFVSGCRDAYQFLSQSILSFQETEQTVEAMCSSGFHSIHIHSFTFGVATLIIASK
jgi:demethylmenaquinone methyltransferase/2-methoxy-6-polyprenyl-1,4-benzoquinol methylase